LPHNAIEQGLVIFIDINKFKSINDTYGHHIGDKVIQVTAQRLEHCVRKEDILARFGGDEFVIFMVGEHLSAGQEKIIDKLMKHLQEPIGIDNVTLMVHYSIGLCPAESVSDSTEMTKDELIDKMLEGADFAMYKAKNYLTEPFAVFDSQLNADMHLGRKKHKEAKMILETGQFNIAFQPIVKGDETIYSVEALLRIPSMQIHSNIEDFMRTLQKSDDTLKLQMLMVQLSLSEYQKILSSIENTNTTPFLNLNMEVEYLMVEDYLSHLFSTIKHLGIEPNNIYIEVTEQGLENSSET